jgi:hypothetical protein
MTITKNRLINIQNATSAVIIVLLVIVNSYLLGELDGMRKTVNLISFNLYSLLTQKISYTRFLLTTCKWIVKGKFLNQVKIELRVAIIVVEKVYRFKKVIKLSCKVYLYG